MVRISTEDYAKEERCTEERIAYNQWVRCYIPEKDVFTQSDIKWFMAKYSKYALLGAILVIDDIKTHSMDIHEILERYLYFAKDEVNQDLKFYNLESARKLYKNFLDACVDICEKYKVQINKENNITQKDYKGILKEIEQLPHNYIVNIQNEIKSIEEKLQKTEKPALYVKYEKFIRTIYPKISNDDMDMFYVFFYQLIVVPYMKHNIPNKKYKKTSYDDLWNSEKCCFRETFYDFFSYYVRNSKCDFFFNGFCPRADLRDVTINNMFFEKFLKAKTINDALFSKLKPGILTLKDFSYIKEVNYIKNILKNGIQNNEQGINILLYGKPGVGKTEFAKALSKELGATLYNTESVFHENKAEQCRVKLKNINLINQVIYNPKKGNIILVDEAEDIFFNSAEDINISKSTFNKTAENTKCPIIWTTNSMWIEPSFLRRFTYCICFDDIPRFKQKEIIENIAKKEDIKISDDIITNMIDNELNFGNVKNILHIAKMNNGTKENIINHIEQTTRSVGNAYKNFKHKDGNYFDPRLTNTDIDLIRLSEKIKSTGKTNFTICSYGAPGTGKSAYAEYLAELLNIPIIKKKTSDLLSMWVGGTEQNIAKAFKEAKDSKAILVFDEADSLLQDRRNARASWEVTQVNEMLVQMENHPYPFICTTNLYDKLDQASLRRFTFKIGYKYMTDNQIKLALKHFFNIDTNVENFHLSTCTAGDFMNIKKQVEFLGSNSYNDIIEMLRKEQENKNDDKPKNKMGFR